jgi:surface antigen
MTMRRVMICGLVGTSLLLAGCQPGYGPKEGGGTAIGAIAGGLIGSRFGGGSGRFATAALGAVAGGLIGSSIGRSMDQSDRLMAERTYMQTLETAPVGHPGQWRNPDSGNYGTITPTRTYEQAGRYCREYEQTINVGGRAERGYGTACRQPDGSWQIVS